MAWYLCTIASTSKNNWNLCKRSLTWGISTRSGYASGDRARKGDYLLFWLGGEGFVGTAEVKEDTRAPISDNEVPWSGGRSQYGLVIPLTNVRIFEKPLKLTFENRVQNKTGLEQFVFQRGYMPISDTAAMTAVSEAKKLNNQLF